jgi:hypothetical protein
MMKIADRARKGAVFARWMLGWRRLQFAALAHLKWRQSPVAKLEIFFDKFDNWL